MKVSLNIENDAELRAYIKDLIKGQVLSIVREDFLEMLKEEINRKLQQQNKNTFEYLLRDATIVVIRDVLYSKHGVSKWNDEFIQPVVEAQVAQAIKNRDLDAMINKMVKDKVKELLDKIQ